MGVSYTSLRDGFALLGIQPQDAKWFMRIVRALIEGRDNDARAIAADVGFLDLDTNRVLRRSREREELEGKLRLMGLKPSWQ